MIYYRKTDKVRSDALHQSDVADELADAGLPNDSGLPDPV